jgi:hypothetical protein
MPAKPPHRVGVVDRHLILRRRPERSWRSPSTSRSADPPLSIGATGGWPRTLQAKDATPYVSEVAQLRVVSPAIDGPNLCPVIRFEGEERFAHWMGGESWRLQRSLDRLFADSGTSSSAVAAEGETGMGPAPPERSRSGATR